MNDLPISKFCYVNDTKLLFSFRVKDSNSAVTEIKSNLRIRNRGFDDKLPFNHDKMKMAFGRHQMLSKLLTFKLSRLGKDQVPAESVKDFSSVIYDPNLHFDKH